MNIGDYGVAGIISGYETQNLSQISNKPFTVPVWGEDVSKTNNTPKTNTNKSRDFIYNDDDYYSLKDMAKTGNFELPGHIHTKTEPTRSDEEILKEIEELAKEHARTGQSTNDDQRFLKLKDEYISSVSPDRADIFKRSMNEMFGKPNGEDYSMSTAFQQIDQQRAYKADEKYKEKEKEKELIDYLLERLENKEYTGYNGEQNTMSKSDMYEVFAQDGVIQSIHFFDPNGKSKGNEHSFDESVMMYSGKRGTFAQQLTQEELSRKKEVYATYNAAYDVACGRKDLKAIDPSETYKEAYNSTYEKLTSGSVA